MVGASKFVVAYWMALRFLRLPIYYYFGFDKWHLTTLAERKYARDIITYLNSKVTKNPQSVAEIGCGLGDMIRKLRFEQRTGYDMDHAVLRAARFLSRLTCNSDIRFDHFHFPHSRLEGRLDFLIMVNWIHHIPGEALKENIELYFDKNLADLGEIIIDTVQDESYKFNHSVKYLTENLRCSVNKIGDDERGREIFSIRKI